MAPDRPYPLPTNSPAATQPSQVDEQGYELQESLLRQQKLLDCLRQRLAPVLTPEVASATAPEKDPRTLAPLAEVIRGWRNSVESASATVEGIIRNLGI